MQCIALQRKTLQWVFIQFREGQFTTVESNLLQSAHPSTPKCSWQLLVLCYKIYSCWHIRTQYRTKNIHRLNIKLLHSARGAVQQEILKLYPVQCSTVQNRKRCAVHYIAVHCKSAICYTVKFIAVQEIELLCIKTIYILKTFQWSALHIKEVQCNSMDSNIDQCSAVECTAAQPRLTKSPKKEEKSWFF